MMTEISSSLKRSRKLTNIDGANVNECYVENLKICRKYSFLSCTRSRSDVDDILLNKKENNSLNFERRFKQLSHFSKDYFNCHSGTFKSKEIENAIANFFFTTNVKVIFVLFLFLQLNQPTTSAVIGTLQRLPAFLNVEAALESSKCTVREEVVNVRTVHPTLPSDATLMPSCVVLRRCSGCCQSERLQCNPTSTYASTVEVSILRPLTNPPYYGIIRLNFTHHESCECQSVSANGGGRCVPRSCRPSEVWNETSCSCEAKCRAQTCSGLMRWNPNKCRCECPRCHPSRLFHARFNQNSQTCQCTCRGSMNSQQRCEKKRAFFNKKTCACGLNQKMMRG